MTHKNLMTNAISTLLAGVLLAGCSTNPISNTGYQQQNTSHYYVGDVAKRELNELEVLGLQAGASLMESVPAMQPRTKELTLAKHSNILLLQSGARFPDATMVSSLSQYWKVSTLSGIRNDYQGHDLNQTLRYAAATGGYDSILVYWGVLETAEENMHTKSLSWVPLVGWSLPDENVKMRVVLRFAVIDAKSGRWRTFQPKAIEMEYLSAMISRKSKQQSKEIELKQQVFEAAAEQLRERFMASDSI